MVQLLMLIEIQFFKHNINEHQNCDKNNYHFEDLVEIKLSVLKKSYEIIFLVNNSQ